MKKNRVTLEELSGKIGISRTTIYKAMNNKGTVSASTRKESLKPCRNLATALISLPRTWH